MKERKMNLIICFGENNPFTFKTCSGLLLYPTINPPCRNLISQKRPTITVLLSLDIYTNTDPMWFGEAVLRQTGGFIHSQAEQRLSHISNMFEDLMKS